jgi:hypothetical protein
MSNDEIPEHSRIHTPQVHTAEESKVVRDRLKAAFSNPTEEQRRFANSIEEVGKRAFAKVVARIRSTIWSVDDGLAVDSSSPSWVMPMMKFLGQVHHTDEQVGLLSPEWINQELRQNSTQDAAAEGHDTSFELQNAFQRHLGEPFDQHSALDDFDADTREDWYRMVLLKAMDRVVVSIAAIEERLECENSNPIWASAMRDFLTQTLHASEAIAAIPSDPGAKITPTPPRF